MKKILVCIITGYLMTAIPAFAAETTKTDSTTQVKHSTTQVKHEEAKKQPSTMHKAGDKVKSGWHKLTASVKKGSKAHACTDEQRSLKQCT